MNGENNPAQLPIGLFDSGVGGLTVLAALLKRLPDESYYFLGDTARLPYGTKSSGTIVRYSLQTTQRLVEKGIKLLVVACNTATAAALPVLQKTYAPLPVIGVIQPGARAACKAVQGKTGGGIVVMATESTINSCAYTNAIHAINPDVPVRGVGATLFVSLAEEGWMSGPIAEGIAARYLEPVLQENKPDCIVLGCTHFPPLAPAIAAVAGPDVVLVDSAATTAEAVEQELERLALVRPTVSDAKQDAAKANPLQRVRFYTTDAPERFARVGSLFLNTPISSDSLELVSL
ncbi:glutamate racemase [Desulfovibrio sp. OttesenSCG-928-G15]|nr:glutamate racemase [Desulfovibrio sp. OttesenSCG-928-G15]